MRSSSGGDGWPAISVSSLRIESVRPAGNVGATVYFMVRATASLDGMTFPVLAQGPGVEQWLVATEVSGRWYVDLGWSNAWPFGDNG